MRILSTHDSRPLLRQIEESRIISHLSIDKSTMVTIRGIYVVGTSMEFY